MGFAAGAGVTAGVAGFALRSTIGAGLAGAAATGAAAACAAGVATGFGAALGPLLLCATLCVVTVVLRVVVTECFGWSAVFDEVAVVVVEVSVAGTGELSVAGAGVVSVVAGWTSWARTGVEVRAMTAAIAEEPRRIRLWWYLIMPIQHLRRVLGRNRSGQWKQPYDEPQKCIFLNYLGTFEFRCRNPFRCRSQTTNRASLVDRRGTGNPPAPLLVIHIPKGDNE